jgi:hypothetical protein
MPNIEPRKLSPGELADNARRAAEYEAHKAKITKRGSNGKGVNFRPTVGPRHIPWSVKG